MADRLKIAILLNAQPIPESYDIGKDGICIEKRLVTDLLSAEAKAIAEAKALKAEKVTVITYGCQNHDDLLKKALALGADDAVHIGKADWAYEPDVKIVAAALKSVVKDYDLLIMADLGNSLYGSELSVACAVALSRNCFNGVMEYAVNGDTLRLKRKLEDGKRQEVLAKMPAVIGVLPDKEYCAYYSLTGKLNAESKEIDRFDISYSLLAHQLGIKLKTDYWQKSTLKPQTKLVWKPDANLTGPQRLNSMVTGEVEVKHGEVVEGSAKECVDKIVDYLRVNNFIEEA